MYQNLYFLNNLKSIIYKIMLRILMYLIRNYVALLQLVTNMEFLSCDDKSKLTNFGTSSPTTTT